MGTKGGAEPGGLDEERGPGGDHRNPINSYISGRRNRNSAWHRERIPWICASLLASNSSSMRSTNYARPFGRKFVDESCPDCSCVRGRRHLGLCWNRRRFLCNYCNGNQCQFTLRRGRSPKSCPRGNRAGGQEVRE